MAQNKGNRKLTRKQHRSEMRKQKKIRRNEYYAKRRKSEQSPSKNKDNIVTNDVQPSGTVSKTLKSSSNKVPTMEQIRNKEQCEKKKIEKEMSKTRKRQLLLANEEEDRVIKQLEKQLGLKKRKTNSFPKSFVAEGLDYLLEVCDPERMKHAIAAEKELHNDDGFEEDFNVMTEQVLKKHQNDSEDEGDSESGEEIEVDESDLNESEIDEDPNQGESDMNDSESGGIDSTDNESDQSEASSKKKPNNKKKMKADTDCISGEESDNESTPNIKNSVKNNPDGTYEDIYGRLRAKDGSVITKKTQTKYIPPAAREKLANNSEDLKHIEKLNRLRRELKGLLNRLAESNMHNIAAQIENLYMNNSRNDMNETLMNLIMESVVSEVVTPERLLIEHVVLIAVLHANIGTEIGAHFLQQMIQRFDELLSAKTEVEDKRLDNNVKILAQLYNFKLFNARLMYDILYKLSEDFEEKEIECILHILKAVGFNLRKDDPAALKKLILDLQQRAAEANKEEIDNSRIKFMLEILLAIKNNNVTKIPNYDVSYPEHLKKILKGLIRKGNYVTQLNISLEDLLKADEKGRWWVVGSAWMGNDSVPEKTIDNISKGEGYDAKLLQLAKKQRMNTDTRRNIFCIIMSAEDYLDAFEKIFKLGLKNQQEREIINVILQCCLQEKKYNPYYAYLAQKFCDYDRKYQIIIKYSMWDKLKALGSHSGSQMSNLTKMLIHLFIEKGLPISTLKVVQFSEIDKVTLRFMRQILIGVLLHENEESCLEAFAKVTLSDKLKTFRETLRLFIHHFLLRNLKSEAIPDNQKVLLEKRARMVEKVLTAKSL